MHSRWGGDPPRSYARAQSLENGGVIFKIDFEKTYNRVRWDFVEEVLTQKGVCPQLKRWIMDTIIGGKGM